MKQNYNAERGYTILSFCQTGKVKHLAPKICICRDYKNYIIVEKSRNVRNLTFNLAKQFLRFKFDGLMLRLHTTICRTDFGK